MKTKLILLLSVLVIASVVIVLPVSAAGNIANITGNPVNYISIYETGDITNWNLIQDSLNVNTSSCTLNVTTNRIGWTVGVHDALDGGKTQPGHMEQWDGVSYGSKYLQNAMVMDSVPLVGSYTTTPVTLNGTSQVIWTGVNGLGGTGSWDPIPITIEQQVVHADESLPSSVYRIIVTFTATNL